MSEARRTARKKPLNDWDRAQVDDRAIWDNNPEQGRLIEAAELRKSDPEGAFKLHLALAEGGSATAMKHVAWAYHTGVGVSEDTARAGEWWRRASEAGSQWALLDYFAFLFKRGEFAKCEVVMSAEAAKGWPPAIFWLASARLRQSNERRKTLREVRALLDRAAEEGSLRARVMLVQEMVRGNFGLREIPRGIELALRMARRWSTEERSGDYWPRRHNGSDPAIP